MIAKNRVGMTLIEIITVISIIILISTIAVTYFRYAQMKARDAIRKADLATIEKALFLYYQDNGHYPYNEGLQSHGERTYLHDGTCFQLTTPLADYLSPKYLVKIPTDPGPKPTGVNNDNGAPWWNYASGANCYAYASDNGTRYVLIANLENANDPMSNKNNDFSDLLMGNFFEDPNAGAAQNLMAIGD